MARALEADLELVLIGADGFLVFVAIIQLGDAVILQFFAAGQRAIVQEIERAI